jgi:hypothetical protein
MMEGTTAVLKNTQQVQAITQRLYNTCYLNLNLSVAAIIRMRLNSTKITLFEGHSHEIVFEVIPLNDRLGPN